LFDAKFLAAYLDAPHLFLEAAEAPIQGPIQQYEEAITLRDVVVEFLGATPERPYASAAANAREKLKPFIGLIRNACKDTKFGASGPAGVLTFRSKRQDLLAAVMSELRQAGIAMFAAFGNGIEREIGQASALFGADIKVDLEREEMFALIAAQVAMAVTKVLERCPPGTERGEIEVDIGNAVVRSSASTDMQAEIANATSNLRGWLL
jgi:hypothetical protein